jgi:hypothetical protein
MGFVESTLNQVVSKRHCKKQPMQWGKRGAHLLLETRVKTVSGQLGQCSRAGTQSCIWMKSTRQSDPQDFDAPLLRHNCSAWRIGAALLKVLSDVKPRIDNCNHTVSSG